MTTITARVPFQAYKADEPEATVQDFNSLSPEVSLPYKIVSAQETLSASLAVVEKDEAHRTTYAVSTVHSACVYLSLLASYIPLMSRSQNAKKVTLDYSLLVRTVMLYGSGSWQLLDMVRDMVDKDLPAESLSITVLSDVEGSMAELEKQYRHEAKQRGAKVEMLRRVATAKVPSRARSNSTAAAGVAADASDKNNEEEESKNSSSAAAAVTPSLSQTSVNGKRRSSARRGSKSLAAAEVEGGEPSLKSAKVEKDVDAAAATAVVPTAMAKRVAPRRRAAPAMLIFGRLRGLTIGEKKAVAALNGVIGVLAHVYANRYNDLVPILDDLHERVKAVQGIMDAERTAFDAKEDKKPPEPFHETTLEGVQMALADSTQTFRDDEECRYELDEDLLHPIAHACLEVINQIEGYATAPYQGLTEEDKKKKRALREAATQKREEAARKVLEKAKAREELAQKREEEKRLMRIRLGGGTADEDDLQDDGEIKNPVPIGYVHYEKTLPLGDVTLYEKALFVWSMIVSVPQPLLLSQMPFSLFIKALEEEDQEANGLMEETTRCLLDLSIEHVRVSSPGTPRITTRGKNWFDALVEFVGVVSGNKKKRQQQRRRAPSTADEEEDEEEDDDAFSTGSSDDDDSTNSSSSSSSPEESEEEEEQREEKEKDEDEAAQGGQDDEAAGAAAATEGSSGDAQQQQQQQPEEPSAEEEDMDSFGVELKATMKHVTALRSLATWGNVDLMDRLNLLQFCVLEAISSDKVSEEADKLFKQCEEDASELEKQVKDIRDEAEKEMRGLLKSLSAHSPTTARSPAGSPTARKEADNGSGDDYEVKKARVLANADKKREVAYARFFSKQDGQDVGAVVQPLGTDRYRRLYWRFPLDRRVLVQTTPATAPDFPLVPEPEALRKRRMGASLFLDDEQEEEATLLGSNRRRGAAAGTAKAKKGVAGDDNDDETGSAVQRTWGVIPAEYIPSFVEGLDPRGERESALRKALEEMAPYVASMEEPQDGRVTRARAHTFGYLNRLKSYF